MTMRIAAGLAALLLLGACASIPERDMRTAPLAVNKTLNWGATNPHPADGLTVFAMADIDQLSTKPLEVYQTPRDDYPSVGGDILHGVTRTPTTDLQPIGPATPGAERLRQPAPRTH